ncbi:MAG TPA: hypothetical protein DDZ68_12365 [Parvularcula sp.]|nr:hypothetical protein [Parvularcula sp.]
MTMSRTSRLLAAGAVSALTIATAAAAPAPEKPELREGPSAFSAEFSAGVEYDDNVSVIDIDNNTGTDDFAAVFDGEVEFAPDIGDDSSFALGYSFSQSLYETFDDFNLQSHLASVDASHDLGIFEIGGAYRFAHSRLGGSPFLTLHQFSPSLSRFFGESLYLRGEYTYTDRNFIGRIDRDGDSHAGAGDAYFFMNGAKTYIALGYRWEKEDAVDPQFDFQGDTLRARFSQRFPLGTRDGHFRIGYRYENRDYSSITPSISALREDKRHRFNAEIEVPLGKALFTRLNAEYGDFQSNLPAADFNQTVVSARIGLRF